MKKVLIFGSSGSIGKNAFKLIKREKNKFKVLGLCVHKDITTLYSQVKEFSPSYVCVRDEKAAEKITPLLKKRRIKLFKGDKGIEEFSSLSADVSLMAISGIGCLKPLMINMKYTKKIALANKESIVVGGTFILKNALKFNTKIIPVDSEINALFRLFESNENEIEKVYITASGGPLLNYKQKDLKKITPKEVLLHPTWKMGKRITVDSATLLNKGFEVIETHRFFNLPFDKIDIVIHKESTIHALIKYKNGYIFACLYPPDMKIPILFALHYSEKYLFSQKDIFNKAFSLNFIPVKINNFPLLKIILEAAKREDNSLVILNACDEVAIDYFLKKKIKFHHLYKVMDYIFGCYPRKKINSVDEIFYWDKWARNKTKEYLKLC
jgi:1-deoxy-D-xylulose-5-phosphate reductoisomerase